MNDESMNNNLLIPFLKDNKWGFSDINRNLVIQNRFDDANFFTKYNLAIVENNKKKFIIDKKGLSISKSYDYISIINDKIAIIREQNKYSVINLNGKQLLAWYDNIETKQNINLLFAYINNDCFIFDFYGNNILEFNFQEIISEYYNSNPYFKITLKNKLTYYITEYNSEIFISDNQKHIYKLLEFINYIYKVNYEHNILKNNTHKELNQIDKLFLEAYQESASLSYSKNNLSNNKDNDIILIIQISSYLIFSPNEDKLKIDTRELFQEYDEEEYEIDITRYDSGYNSFRRLKSRISKRKYKLRLTESDSYFNIPTWSSSYNINFDMYAGAMIIQGEDEYDEDHNLLNMPKLTGFINKNGKQITPYIFTEILAFRNEGTVAIAKNKNGVYVINSTTHLHEKINYNITYKDIESEFIFVKIGDFHGVIDINMCLIIPIKYNAIINYNAETKTFLVELNNTRFYISINGNQFTDKEIQRKIISDKEDTKHFNKSLSVVYVKQINMYAIIDDNEHQQSSLFEEINPLINNRAIVKFNGKYGLINELGELITQCKYDRFEDFKDNIAEVYIHSKKLYVDINGIEYKSSLSYSTAFENKLIPYSEDNKWGFVDENENLSIPCYYDSVEEFDDNELSVVTFMTKKCLIDKKGTQKTSWYKSIQRIEKNIYVVESGEGFWIIKGNEDRRLTKVIRSSIKLTKVENNWYIINSSGCLNPNYEEKISGFYNKIEYYNEKLFKVYKNKNWGFVNHENILCWEYIEPPKEEDDDDYIPYDNSNEITARDAFDDDEQYEDWLNR